MTAPGCVDLDRRDVGAAAHDAATSRASTLTPALLERVTQVVDARLRDEPLNGTLWARRAWAMNAQRRPLEALSDARTAARCLANQNGVRAEEKKKAKLWTADAALRLAVDDEDAGTTLPRVRINEGFAQLQLGQYAAAIACYEAAYATASDRSDKATVRLCSKMIERAHQFSAATALATAKARGPAMVQSDEDDEVAASVPLGQRAAPTRTDCDLLLSLHVSVADDSAKREEERESRRRLRLDCRSATQTPTLCSSTTTLDSPTGVNQSPVGVEEALGSARIYKPYSALFADDDQPETPAQPAQTARRRADEASSALNKKRGLVAEVSPPKKRHLVRTRT